MTIYIEWMRGRYPHGGVWKPWAPIYVTFDETTLHAGPEKQFRSDGVTPRTKHPWYPHGSEYVEYATTKCETQDLETPNDYAY